MFSAILGAGSLAMSAYGAMESGNKAQAALDQQAHALSLQERQMNYANQLALDEMNRQRYFDQTPAEFRTTEC